MRDQVWDDAVRLPAMAGVPELTLSIRRASGSPELPPLLLVHGLASNARVWDGVTRRLAVAGHEVAAVDLRGHGRSEGPEDGYDTRTCAEDLHRLCAELGWTAARGRAPVVAGQSWGGNVVLTLVATHPDAARAIALVDGGWLALGRRFATFKECWEALAPPCFDGARYDDLARRIRDARPDWPDEGVTGTLANLRQRADGGVVARLARDHHRAILHSMWIQDPAAYYPGVVVPTLLVPVGSPEPGPPSPTGTSVDKAAAVAAMLEMVPTARARWYPDTDHDVHAQRPAELAIDLLDLATGSEGGDSAIGRVS
jgi:pimeloyl-ACP methyl ester carboxylesterase